MARDPARIEPMIAALRIYWNRYPDLRLGQIVGNMAADDWDPYYIEDNIMAERLLKAIRDEPRGR